MEDPNYTESANTEQLLAEFRATKQYPPEDIDFLKSAAEVLGDSAIFNSWVFISALSLPSKDLEFEALMRFTQGHMRTYLEAHQSLHSKIEAHFARKTSKKFARSA